MESRVAFSASDAFLWAAICHFSAAVPKLRANTLQWGGGDKVKFLRAPPVVEVSESIRALRGAADEDLSRYVAPANWEDSEEEEQEQESEGE